MKKFILFLFITFLFYSVYIFNISYTGKNYLYVNDLVFSSFNKEISIPNNEITMKAENVLEISYGTVTAYTSDCNGCIGITAFGYDVINTIYYYDLEYGSIRIVAMDKVYPFGTIVKLEIDNDIIGIVLDRGSLIGNNNFSQVDLLIDTKNNALNFGKKENIKIEVLRLGF